MWKIIFNYNFLKHNFNFVSGILASRMEYLLKEGLLNSKIVVFINIFECLLISRFIIVHYNFLKHHNLNLVSGILDLRMEFYLKGGFLYSKIVVFIIFFLMCKNIEFSLFFIATSAVSVPSSML